MRRVTAVMLSAGRQNTVAWDAACAAMRTFSKTVSSGKTVVIW